GWGVDTGSVGELEGGGGGGGEGAGAGGRQTARRPSLPLEGSVSALRKSAGLRRKSATQPRGRGRGSGAGRRSGRGWRIAGGKGARLQGKSRVDCESVLPAKRALKPHWS